MGEFERAEIASNKDQEADEIRIFLDNKNTALLCGVLLCIFLVNIIWWT